MIRWFECIFRRWIRIWPPFLCIALQSWAENGHFWCFCDCWPPHHVGKIFLMYEIILLSYILSRWVQKWPSFFPFIFHFSEKATFARENEEIWRLFVMPAIHFGTFSWTHGRVVLMYLKLLNPNMTSVFFLSLSSTPITLNFPSLPCKTLCDPKVY